MAENKYEVNNDDTHSIDLENKGSNEEEDVFDEGEERDEIGQLHKFKHKSTHQVQLEIEKQQRRFIHALRGDVTPDSNYALYCLLLTLTLPALNFFLFFHIPVAGPHDTDEVRDAAIGYMWFPAMLLAMFQYITGVEFVALIIFGVGLGKKLSNPGKLFVLLNIMFMGGLGYFIAQLIWGTPPPWAWMIVFFMGSNGFGAFGWLVWRESRECDEDHWPTFIQSLKVSMISMSILTTAFAGYFCAFAYYSHVNARPDTSWIEEIWTALLFILLKEYAYVGYCKVCETLSKSTQCHGQFFILTFHSVYVCLVVGNTSSGVQMAMLLTFDITMIVFNTLRIVKDYKKIEQNEDVEIQKDVQRELDAALSPADRAAQAKKAQKLKGPKDQRGSVKKKAASKLRSTIMSLDFKEKTRAKTLEVVSKTDILTRAWFIAFAEWVELATPIVYLLSVNCCYQLPNIKKHHCLFGSDDWFDGDEFGFARAADLSSFNRNMGVMVCFEIMSFGICIFFMRGIDIYIWNALLVYINDYSPLFVPTAVTLILAQFCFMYQPFGMDVTLQFSDWLQQ